MISDSEFFAWLAADGKIHTILCEAKYWDGSAEQTMYLSNTGYVTKPTETPANTPYLSCIASIPSFSSSLSMPTPKDFKITASAKWGDIKISNAETDKDDWLNLGWAGRKITLYIGDPDWARADFRPLLNGYIEALESDAPESLVLRIRGREYLLDVPISRNNLITGTDAGKPKPMAFGSVFNVSPVLVNSATMTYMVHDGTVNNIVARDSGVTLTITQTGDGTFNLTTGGTGSLTADVQGAKPSGTYLTTVSDLVKYILTAFTSLTTSDLDLPSFASHAALCPQTVGVYVRNGTKVIDVVNQLLAGVGSYFTWTTTGLLRIVRLDVPSNTPVLTLGGSSVELNSLKIKQVLQPVYQVNLGYAQNYNPQDTVAGSVTTANRDLYRQEYRTAVATNSSILTAYPLAAVPDQYNTCLQITADAFTEASRLLTLHGVQRGIYAIDASVGAYQLQLGDTVCLVHPRFGFSAGRNCVVVEMDYYPDKNKTALSLWL